MGSYVSVDGLGSSRHQTVHLDPKPSTLIKGLKNISQIIFLKIISNKMVTQII